MPATKEAELNAALLQYMAKCLAEGDEAALAHLGLDRQSAKAIESLHLLDLEHLSSLHFPLLRATAIDRDLLQRLVQHVYRQRSLKSMRDTLLALNAPLPMMHHYFGMDSTEYAEQGRRLGVIRTSGRPTEPSETEEAAIWHALGALEKPAGEDLTAEECLTLCQQSGLSPRTLWLVTRRDLTMPHLGAVPPRKERRSSDDGEIV